MLIEASQQPPHNGAQGARSGTESDAQQPILDPTRRTVIMGAGPAGLTAAYELMRYHVPSVTLEKDPRP